MQLAEVALGLVQRIDDRLLLRHIDAHRHDPLVGAGEAVRRLLDGILLDIRHDDVGAGLGERSRNAEADAGGGAGHDRGFAGDVDHYQASVSENSGRNR